MRILVFKASRNLGRRCGKQVVGLFLGRQTNQFVSEDHIDVLLKIRRERGRNGIGPRGVGPGHDAQSDKRTGGGHGRT